MTASSLRIIFAGTPDFAAAHLSDLLNRGFNIVAAYTQPDRPVGRGKKIRPTPVKEVALTHGIPVFQPEELQGDEALQLAALSPDIIVVVAYGLILDEEILQIPPYGCINVHASLLPRWRGAAPIERAILAGDKVTGVSIMQMEKGLDTGAVLLRLNTPITNQDNAQTLTSRLLTLGNQGLAEVLNDIPGYQANAEQQDDSLAVYASKLRKDEALIQWQNPAIEIQHQIQAFYPRSPAYCLLQNDRLRIIQAISVTSTQQDKPGTILAKEEDRILVACGEGALEITKIQFPGKNPAGLKDVFNGHPDLFNPGDSLSDDSDSMPDSKATDQAL